MKLVELILDEEQLTSGVEAISVVSDPAIESNFIALKSAKMAFKTIDKEKRILLGALLIPNKPILRNQELNGVHQKFHCYFSAETIEQASQWYLKNGNQSNATLEHQMSVNGLTLVESWIKVDAKLDKSMAYGIDEPVGTWFGAIKVDNEKIWTEFVKTGKVRGFSIEGFFANRAVKMEKVNPERELLKEIGKLLEEWKGNSNR